MVDPRSRAPRRIGLVTDSNSQITPELIARYGVEVVPLTVTVDGREFSEGIDLDADAFYARFAGGVAPAVSTSHPAPDRFAEAYRHLAERGCTEIVSIHIAAAMSGTVGSATLAGAASVVPVHVIDTGTASFGVSACVWAAAEAIAVGADGAGVRAVIGAFAPCIGTAFMIGVPTLVDRGSGAGWVAGDGEGVPVLVMSGGRVEVLARVSTIEDTIDVMSTYAAGWPDRITVAVGLADPPSWPLADRVRATLVGLPQVDQVVEYRVGPTVGAHTGPGTFGLFVFPTPG